MTEASPLSSLLDIAEEHRQINEMILRHQEALIGLEFTQALGSLEELSRRISRHMRREEEILLPAYVQAGAFPAAGHPDMMLDEHRRIDQSMKDLLAAARGLTLGAGVRRAVILLLERETRFKALLHQHSQREEAFLFPRLRERWTTVPSAPENPRDKHP
jgi:iron-sulfur cluster repair protein YtfE (RIC family)